MSDNFIKYGYAVIPKLISRDLIAKIKKDIVFYTETNSINSIRYLHRKISAINNLANSSLILNTIKKHHNYNQFKLVKSIFFNKNTNYNWSVAWHQDKTIAVKEKVDFYNYKNWTKKQGIYHVQPPLNILEKITTVRIALDDVNSKNGGLKIIPNSHKIGILDRLSIDKIVDRKKQVLCSLNAGDAIIMHPLLLHSSNKSTSNQERRIIHLEYSSAELPNGLTWYA